MLSFLKSYNSSEKVRIYVCLCILLIRLLNYRFINIFFSNESIQDDLLVYNFPGRFLEEEQNRRRFVKCTRHPVGVWGTELSYWNRALHSRNCHDASADIGLLCYEYNTFFYKILAIFLFEFTWSFIASGQRWSFSSVWSNPYSILCLIS